MKILNNINRIVYIKCKINFDLYSGSLQQLIMNQLDNNFVDKKLLAEENYCKDNKAKIEIDLTNNRD